MVQLSWPQTGVFLALLAASIYGFWFRFGRVWNIILASKKDPDFHIQPVGRRVSTCIWEVLRQGKVIRQRPLPGLAHAFVFWGFCAFALVTINHFAAALHIELISRDGFFGRIYFAVAAAFAVLVAVSIASLAFRRFVIRPKWLGPLSYQSGVIALLIFLLMITYLMTFLPGGDTNQALWWAHTLTLLVFMPLIPHTKHLHLVLSPITVFLKRGGFSKIPPLAGDEDFGLDTGKDITELVSLQAYSCV